MIWWAAIIGLLGLALSSLFSGSETGFYRATRLRLVLDSIAGDWVSRGLLWLVNRPALFVATALVGNNLANYLVSLGVVICAQQLFGGEDHAAELIAPLVLAPLLFVYGELLPKNLFLQAPNRLLRRVGPVLLGFTVLFLPLSGLLWGLNRLLAALIAEPPERVRRRVARRELRRAVAEGHEAGILRAVQVALAEGVLGLASQPVARRITPLAELPRARADMTRQQVLTLARRYRVPLVCVESASRPGELIGYVRVWKRPARVSPGWSTSEAAPWGSSPCAACARRCSGADIWKCRFTACPRRGPNKRLPAACSPQRVHFRQIVPRPRERRAV